MDVEFMCSPGDPWLDMVRKAKQNGARVSVGDRSYEVISITEIVTKSNFPNPVKVVLR